MSGAESVARWVSMRSFWRSSAGSFRFAFQVASAAILQPGVASKESALLIFLALTLIARTGLDIWFSAFNGVVVRSIVSRDWPLFVKNAVVLFGVMMWPMSAVNNFLKLTINRLSLSFRTRLTHYAHEQYLKGITFYKVANLDNRIQNADQLLTQVPRVRPLMQGH